MDGWRVVRCTYLAACCRAGSVRCVPGGSVRCGRERPFGSLGAWPRRGPRVSTPAHEHALRLGFIFLCAGWLDGFTRRKRGLLMPASAGWRCTQQAVAHACIHQHGVTTHLVLELSWPIR